MQINHLQPRKSLKTGFFYTLVRLQLMLIRAQYILFALFLAVPNAHAGCSETLHGTSYKYQIDISDNGCTYPEIMITSTQIDSNGYSTKNMKPIPFASECKIQPWVSIECKADGKSPLAGTKYRSTNDTNPRCGGTKRGQRYTCIKGCENGAPPYLYWDPYEC